MPLPAALSSRASKKKKRARMQQVMHELKHGKVNSPSRKSAKRRGTFRAQSIAIALRNSGQGRKRKRKAKRRKRR